MGRGGPSGKYSKVRKQRLGFGKEEAKTVRSKCQSR